jgi:hypothetical protein
LKHSKHEKNSLHSSFYKSFTLKRKTPAKTETRLTLPAAYKAASGIFNAVQPSEMVSEKKKERKKERRS